MDKQLQEIINAYNEFKRYTYILKEEIQELNKYSRQELIEFNKALREVNDFAYISGDIDKIIGQKKIEEFPQLLKAHHYPEINEMDFLSEEDKINLDNYLSSLRISGFICKGATAWYKITMHYNRDIIQKIFDFLLSKNIIERQYKIVGDRDDSIIITKNDIDKYLRYFELKERQNLSDEEWDEYYNLENLLELSIWSMDFESEGKLITKDMIKEAINDNSYWVYRLIKPRDNSLDNV